MKKRLLRVAAVAFVLIACGSRASLGAPSEAGARDQAAATPQPALTREQMAHFLKTAKVIGHKGISRGVTHPARLTLSDGTLTHDAAFSRVDEHKPIMQFPGGRTELDFVDWSRLHARRQRDRGAARHRRHVPRHRRARVGSRHGRPELVARRHDARGRSPEESASPPDAEDWAKQQYTMRVFTQLVDDTDRNVGNILIDKDWKIHLIDFTRAFRRPHELRAPQLLQRCDKNMLAKLRGLKVEDVKARISKWVPPREIESMMARRDALVALYDKLIAERGEARVLF